MRPRHHTHNVGAPSRFGGQGGNYFDNLTVNQGNQHLHSRYSGMTNQTQHFYQPAPARKGRF